MIRDNWTVINQLLVAYFLFLATLSLKKYLYLYLKDNPALQKYDFPLL